jgi:hypothetical protein
MFFRLRVPDPITVPLGTQAAMNSVGANSSATDATLTTERGFLAWYQY